MKYQITLTEKQARLLSGALDQFPRLIQGQDSSFQGLMESAWEKRCKEATGDIMDEEWDGGWSAMREDAERICKEIKKRFWGLEWNANYGIRYNDVADILYDMHCVLRHALWKSKPEPKSHWTVDAFGAHKWGSEPLAKVGKEGWIPVEESLPETDEEVIVLADSILTAPFYRIGFGHIVKEVAVDIDGKPYKPISHNGWNIPGVKYWMPCPEIPNSEEI